VKLSDISIKALTIGLTIDMFGGILAQAAFGFFYAGLLLSQGVAQPDVSARILADNSFFVATVIIGDGFLAAGAFVAAHIARARKVVHAGLVGGIGIVLSLVLAAGSAPDPSMYPAWFRPVLYGLAMPVALFAGYIAQRHARPR